jgi:hypothetical protein
VKYAMMLVDQATNATRPQYAAMYVDQPTPQADRHLEEPASSIPILDGRATAPSSII